MTNKELLEKTKLDQVRTFIDDLVFELDGHPGLDKILERRSLAFRILGDIERDSVIQELTSKEKPTYEFT